LKPFRISIWSKIEEDRNPQPTRPIVDRCNCRVRRRQPHKAPGFSEPLTTGPGRRAPSATAASAGTGSTSTTRRMQTGSSPTRYSVALQLSNLTASNLQIRQGNMQRSAKCKTGPYGRHFTPFLIASSTSDRMQCNAINTTRATTPDDHLMDAFHCCCRISIIRPPPICNKPAVIVVLWSETAIRYRNITIMHLCHITTKGRLLLLSSHSAPHVPGVTFRTNNILTITNNRPLILIPLIIIANTPTNHHNLQH